MKILFWIVAVPAIAIAMSFGVSNPESVSIGLWPLVHKVQMPVYAAVTVALFFGFFVGVLIAWIDSLRHRAEARRLARRLRELEAEDARLRRELAMARGNDRVGGTDSDSEAALRRLNVATYE
ncbi:MAG TPA: lipopolysaccharide assembly protein LapA domain-containing protein [Alphaproteobacteria bacterium]|jgi:uncharacterized membrane protein YciS (DUF1049 family)